MRRPSIVALGSIAVLVSCSSPAARSPDAKSPVADSSWLALNVDSLPNDSLGASIRRGRAIFVATRDSLPAYAPSALRCASCHLNEGRQLGATPLYGSYGRYPAYLVRAGGVVTIEDRINYCFTRSLAGWKVPEKSSEMRDIVAYVAFLSRGIPAGADPATTLIPKLAPPSAPGDSARGYLSFVTNCSRCHGADALGTKLAPPLWGKQSFSIGASMARVERAASFIVRNMPADKPGSLSTADAWDIATYVTSLPRTDLPGKELDYPTGHTPDDVPYKTAGHVPRRAVTVIPRERPRDALVPISASVKRR